jgi:HAD superfamily phosphoserine phosphatase-like hydrolase
MASWTKIAAFDVCGTIYNSNTTFDFLKYYFKDNEKYSIFRNFTNTIPVRLINKAFVFLFKKDFVRTFATSFLKNESLDKIEIASEYFVTKHLKDRFILPTIELLKRYKDKDYQIVLISASYDFIVKYVAKEVGADFFFASVLSQKNGLSNGTYKEDLQYNKSQYFFSRYENIEEFVFITDNKSDLDLINLANIVYIITPERNAVFWIKKGIPKENLIVL